MDLCIMIEAFEIKPAFTIKLFTYMKGDGPHGKCTQRCRHL